jgi:NADH-quinone oxidoreductase subunit E
MAASQKQPCWRYLSRILWKVGEIVGKIQEIIIQNQDKQGGIIEAYHAIQKEFNYLPQEAISEASRAFGVSEAQAYGVATFYSYLSVKPRGKYIIRMCESAPCHIAGADEVIKAIESELGIKVGETTADGKFTLELTECVGQCQATPVITVNSEPIFDVTPQQVPEILRGYK